MYLQEQRILYYSELLGTHRPDIKLKLEALKRNWKLANKIESQLLSMLKWEGFDLTDLPLFCFPMDRKTEGILVGYGVYNGRNLGPLYDSPEVFTERNVISAGETRTGKTFGIVNILSQVPKHDPKRTIVIYDDEDEYAGYLGNFFGPEKLVRIRYSDYKRSMLQNIEHYGDEWIGALKRIWMESTFVGDTVNLLANAVKRLCPNPQIQAGGGYPTLSEVLHHINRSEQKGKLFLYQQTLSTRVADIVIFLGPVYETKRGFTWDDFKGKIVVIDMSGMDETAQVLFKNFEIMDIKFYCRTHPDSKMTVVLDELHRFLTFREGEMFKPILLDAIKTGLKKNLNFFMGEQNASSVHQDIRGNAPTKFVYKTQDERDRKPLGYSLNLDRERMQELAFLPREHCIYHSETLEGPVLIRIPHLYLTDKSREVAEWSEPFIKESHRRFGEKPRMDSGIEIREFGYQDNEESGPTYEKKDSGYQVLSNQWKGYINDCIDFPVDNRKKHQKRLGLSNWELVKITSALSRNNHIKPHQVSWGKPGSSEIIDEVTEQGYRFVGKKYTPLKGKGSFYHRIIQLKLSRTLKNVVIEYNGADLAWIKPNGVTVALEVELSPENKHILTNIRRDLSVPGPRGFLFSAVWIVCINKKDMEKISCLVNESLEPSLRNRVEFKLLREVL